MTADLNLWKHHLGAVPESVFDHHDAGTLVLAENDLTSIPGRIGALAICVDALEARGCLVYR